MEKNLNWLDRLARFVLAAIFIFAAVVLFKHQIARILAWAIVAFALWEAIWTRCYLTSYLGSKSIGQRLNDSSLCFLGLVAVQMTLAYEWWSAGWEKISNSEFVNNIGNTLGYFVSNNPFPWYKDFLLGYASRNSTFFAYAVEWGQIAVAVVLVVFGALYVYSRNLKIQKLSLCLSVLALLSGIVMNASFYLAAGWTGPATRNINVLMFWIQAILIYIWLYKINQLK